MKIYLYVSYSCPNGWTKLAEIFLRESMSELGVR